MALFEGLSTGLFPLAQSGRASFQSSSFVKMGFSILFKSSSLGLGIGLFPLAQSGLASFQYSDACVEAGLFVSFFRREVDVHSGFGFVFGFASDFSLGLPLIELIGFVSRSLAVRAQSGPYNNKLTDYYH